MAKVEDVVRVTTAPWAGQRGIVERVDGAYNIVRLDTSQHPDDVQELYPNEFVVLCQECEHDKHEPGKCEVLHIYARGPNDPPGNQGCLCGYTLETVTTQSNDEMPEMGRQFYTDDWDDQPDVPIDNFFWKDGDFKVKLDTTAFGIFVAVSESLRGTIRCPEELPIKVPDIAAGLRKMAEILEERYSGPVHTCSAKLQLRSNAGHEIVKCEKPEARFDIGGPPNITLTPKEEEDDG